MEDHKSLIGTLFDKTEHYTRTAADLQKLKAVEKAADVGSTLAANLLVIVVLALFFIISNIGLALFLGELMQKYYLGFFVVGSFYLLLGIVFYFTKKLWIKDPLQNFIVKQALKVL
jgi:phosphoglycerol transferase MdoB-like AlkP superfamily enzyme